MLCEVECEPKFRESAEEVEWVDVTLTDPGLVDEGVGNDNPETGYPYFDPDDVDV